VPDACALQVDPALVVEVITPLSPTAEHALVVAHEIPNSDAKLPEF
jgi:hypothetical protein